MTDRMLAPGRGPTFEPDYSEVQGVYIKEEKCPMFASDELRYRSKEDAGKPESITLMLLEKIKTEEYKIDDLRRKIKDSETRKAVLEEECRFYLGLGGC